MGMRDNFSQNKHFKQNYIAKLMGQTVPQSDLAIKMFKCENDQLEPTRIAVRVESPAASLDSHVGLAPQSHAEIGGHGGVAGAQQELRPV